ncbi:hypothetical protein J2W22_002067 [Sphingomonas kyeonggiensis]|uniref:hypothetical protein n=1 Tax=Sphingomonas kyeonggiensis TaxID=1268553 RepID=UPI002785BC8C|nr:hypothetical protein [Sphingomonas kyeonggiensis]MDQ0250003.1 hypothetical protein [Sphingomonas kyeonggiensis]
MIALLSALLLAQADVEPCEEICIGATYNGNKEWERIDPIAFRDMLAIIRPYDACYLEKVAMRSSIVERGKDLETIESASILGWNLCEKERNSATRALSERLVTSGKSQEISGKLAVQFRAFFLSAAMLNHFKRLGLDASFKKYRKGLSRTKH